MKSFALLSAVVALATASPFAYPRQPLCNANAEACNTKYSNISYIGTHNSAFVGDRDDPRVNQEQSVTQQLDAGIRFLQAQTHKDVWGTLSMCHTDCWLMDAGSLEDYLSTVKKWMDDNPDALITMLLGNGDNVDVDEFADAFDRANLKHYAFIPPTSPEKLEMEDWPTLGEMIGDGTRLVMFLDYGADETKVPYIMPEFKYFFETPFSTDDLDQCKIDRPSEATADGRMYIVNHVLSEEITDDLIIPNEDAISDTNAATGPGSIGAHVKLCREAHGRTPNFVLVDYFNRGEWLPAQQAMNDFI
ncbi:Vacuolar protein sorting-associated protein 8 [Vermiconidia calcicola]|uniref:Vacuolar protein sorting-associated protein 8 n=1 Tax=Vermiconidia calcicola TaxID=1690605 RepID=A0ACC3NXV2_9PEZI|nr:Vacuolar protein sorting-associated protein 8 [Vermiconidia calcicola]